MRVALLAPLRFPLAEPFAGGLEWHAHVLARELTGRGLDVTVFAHPDSLVTGTLVPVAIPKNASNWTYAAVLYRLAKRLRAADFDVVLNNTIHFFPDLFRPADLPMISVLHTPPYRLHRLLGRFVRARSRFVSISRVLAKTWRPYLGDAPVVIHNGVDTERWRFGPVAEPRTAVWYGRFTPEKGAEYAIRAARAAGWRLRLAGPVYDAGYFQTVVEPLLGHDVEYLGHLDQAALVEVVRTAAVGLVTPVWDEPFGLVYAELLSCGVPVVGFRSGAAAEVLTEAVSTLVGRGEEGALTRVLRDWEEQGEEARGGNRAYAVERFGVGVMVAGYVEMMESIFLEE